MVKTITLDDAPVGDKLDEILNNLDPSKIWVCPDCGSPDIERMIKQWINLNTNEDCGGADDIEYFCNGCLDFVTDVTMMDKYNRKNLK